ncbi:Phosphohydrolase OS=Streptomyces antimycoticus OX=68175 GN=SSPO_090490 PE=4 SV=1 [Streptomyces antimycoticus]
MYADKFHSKTSPPKFLTADSYAIHVRRFGGDKVDGFQLLRVRFGEPDLRSLQARYGHPLS